MRGHVSVKKGCSRLSDNAAPGTAETETVFRSCGRDDDAPSCWGNVDAGSQPGNPDVRVPEKTTRENGLCACGPQEVKDADTEEPEKGDTENKSEDRNSRVPLQTEDQPWEKNNAAKRDIRHVPGGAWLTKIHHIPGALQGPADYLTRFPDPSALYQSRSWDGVCSRLSDNAAPGAAETETVFRSCGRDDDAPGCWGNVDAGSQPGNPDVRVPEKTTREDGLCARGAQEKTTRENGLCARGKQEVKVADTEEPEKGDAEHKSEDGNSGVPLQTEDQPWEKNNAAKRDIRHVPGGM
ncbi:hypothetical protein NDU88_005230 [Pleurodeles waltl]|uniref:Uncharacterized protein n=1 Tax=Pleurodeles waltl TaxID=8319 RepID=A0AAV7WBE7_PLEWA|nr:hypothetical protein NDU88_005230 [Pleurodeles waltl]